MAKKKIICDTDVMIDYWDTSNARHVITKTKLENSIELDNIILSAITKMELMLGAANKAEMVKISMQLNRFNIALINNEITLQALELLQKYHLSHGLMLADSFIASTAIIADVELFTYNIKDFKFIPKLNLYS